MATLPVKVSLERCEKSLIENPISRERRIPLYCGILVCLLVNLFSFDSHLAIHVYILTYIQLK